MTTRTGPGMDGSDRTAGGLQQRSEAGDIQQKATSRSQARFNPASPRTSRTTGSDHFFIAGLPRAAHLDVTVHITLNRSKGSRAEEVCRGEKEGRGWRRRGKEAE